jgi:hypothetical protein
MNAVAAYVKRVEANMPQCLIKNRIINNQFERNKFSPSEIAAFNYVDLISFLVWYDNSSLVYLHRQLYLKSNPKCVVKPEGIYDLSTMAMFRPLAALTVFYDMSKEAACFAIYTFSRLSQYDIARYVEIHYPDVHKSELPAGRDLSYILKNDLLYHAETQEKAKSILYSVLAGEYHIDRGIVTHLIYHRLVALDDNLDICFLTYEGKQVVGITKLRKKDNYVSYKEYVSMSKRFSGFVYELGDARISKKYKDAYIFDGVIEMLSYATLSKKECVTKLNNDSICLSTNGNLAVELCSMSTLDNNKTKAVSKLDVNLSPLLNKSPDIWQIWFGFNSNCYIFNETLRRQLRYKKTTNLQEQLSKFSEKCGTVNVYTWNEMLRIKIKSDENNKNSTDKTSEEVN